MEALAKIKEENMRFDKVYIYIILFTKKGLSMFLVIII